MYKRRARAVEMINVSLLRLRSSPQEGEQRESCTCGEPPLFEFVSPRCELLVSFSFVSLCLVIRVALVIVLLVVAAFSIQLGSSVLNGFGPLYHIPAISTVQLAHTAVPPKPTQRRSEVDRTGFGDWSAPGTTGAVLATRPVRRAHWDPALRRPLSMGT